MSKESFYFSHDYGARNDPKLQKVLMKLGQAGKGVFWDLVEMVHEEGGKLLLSECESYAFALRTDLSCITSLINDFDLFQNDEVFFWSNSANRRINEKLIKSEKARNSALNRWNSNNLCERNANASKNDAIKESKEKESKENNIVLSEISNEIQTDIIIPKNKWIETFDKRKDDFKKSLYPFTKYQQNPSGLYSREMILAFFEYWNEPNKSRSKMKWESEKTWDLSKRLLRWANNNYKSDKQTTTTTVYISPQKSINDQYLDPAYLKNQRQS